VEARTLGEPVFFPASPPRSQIGDLGMQRVGETVFRVGRGASLRIAAGTGAETARSSRGAISLARPLAKELSFRARAILTG
jgi:hypothetical protein